MPLFPWLELKLRPDGKVAEGLRISRPMPEPFSTGSVRRDVRGRRQGIIKLLGYFQGLKRLDLILSCTFINDQELIMYS